MIAPHTTATNEKAPLERGNFGATEQKHGANNTADRVISKAFSTWQARFAMLGHKLYPVPAANGATAFLVTRWGMVRELSNLDEVAKFFALIGGKA